VNRWTTDRVWDAVDDWKWVPPGATKVVTDSWELAVTPGSYALTYVYGFHSDANQADRRIDDLRKRVEELGGTGARFHLTPRSSPPDLAERLLRHGFKPLEEADVLVWLLRDAAGNPKLPVFPPASGITIRDVLTDDDYDVFLVLGTTIFGDPAPSPDVKQGFIAEFHRTVREEGHSGRFLAWEGTSPIGRGGMEIVGPVARFWGTGVLAEHRRRGVYGALVRARCEAAVDRGAEIALVTARVGTSGPILRHHGFQPMGTTRVFEAQWQPGGS
jgi:GNAT superfamily N-acetyltransferase